MTRKQKTDKSEQRAAKLKRIKMMSSADIAVLIDDLETHQIELELQNTELQEAQQELFEAHDLYSKLYNYAPVGYVTTDTQGVILEANLTLVDMLSTPKYALTKMNLADLIDVKDQDLYFIHRRNLLTGPDVLEFRIRGASTHPIWVRMESRPVQNSAGVVYVFRSVLSDITELVIAREKLELRAEELARSNTDLQNFAYIASHDLQEPLRMVSSFAGLLAKKYEKSLDETAQEYIYFITDGAKRMNQLIEDLLSYSKLTNKPRKTEMVNLDLMLKYVLQDMKQSIEESKTEVTLYQLPEIMADASQMRQLFQNLISNAIKFRSESPPKILIKAEIKHNIWYFSISDNGIGLPVGLADRAFMMFGQLHSKDEYPGSGMGLALVKRIVERHGGEISIDANYVDGTCVKFTLNPEKYLNI